MADDEGIRVTAAGGFVAVGHEPVSVRWRLIRVALMRLLSALWMMRGLLAWAAILGAAPGPAFETLPLRLQVLVAVSAVLYCIAAVGLWLAASWGAALWLLLSAGEAAVLYLLPRSGLTSLPILALTVGAALLFALLSWLARREARQRPR